MLYINFSLVLFYITILSFQKGHIEKPEESKSELEITISKMVNNLSLLESVLAENSYASGHKPSILDKLLYEELNKNQYSPSSYPYIHRWFNHMKSFDYERDHFPPLQVSHIHSSL